jgi:hypothetical protein
VETFDLSSTMLGTGDPVSIEADGDTVYGTADSLYIASGNQWAWNGDGAGAAGTAGGASPGLAGIRQETQIYRFALQGSAPPRFAASGTVPGYLVDQYALSEWNGYLRAGDHHRAVMGDCRWGTFQGCRIGASVVGGVRAVHRRPP